MQSSVEAGCAGTVYHKVNGIGFEIFGQSYFGDRELLETVCFFTNRAVKMNMHIIGIGAGTVVAAKGIFCISAVVVNLMDKSVFMKSFQCAV